MVLLRRSNDNSTGLAREGVFLELDLLHIGARDDDQANIATNPVDRGRGVPRLLDCFADDVCRRRAVLVGEGKDDVAVLWRD
jgi:hypothetical protein